MSLKTFFAKISAWLHDIVKAADAAIKALSPELRTAMEQGSNLVNIINTNFAKSPQEITALLQLRFPNLTEADLQAALAKAAEAINIGEDFSTSSSLFDMISKLQKYLAEIQQKDGARWAQQSSLIAKVIANFFAPAGTKTNVFELLMETFYQLYVKKQA